jgi:hypothetical protein
LKQNRHLSVLDFSSLSCAEILVATLRSRTEGSGCGVLLLVLDAEGQNGIEGVDQDLPYTKRLQSFIKELYGSGMVHFIALQKLFSFVSSCRVCTLIKFATSTP